MLTLTAKEGEAVYLFVPGRSKPIVVTVTQIRNCDARISFGADKDITIKREKLLAGVLKEEHPKT